MKQRKHTCKLQLTCEQGDKRPKPAECICTIHAREIKIYVLVLVKSGAIVMRVNNYITLETILGINGKVEKIHLMIKEFHS